MKRIFIQYALFISTLLLNIACNKDDVESNIYPIQQLKDTVIDVDGNIYHTIKIGKQIWMQENLNVTKFRNGESILKDTIFRYWDSYYSGAWCEHPDITKDRNQFGKLYNFGAVNNTKGLAPIGWHVPTDGEWSILIENLGGIDVAGGKMKESGIAHWATPNNTADNRSGFTALPGGYRSDNGQFFGLGSFISCWWSSTSTSSNNDNAYYRFITSDSSGIIKDYGSRYFGFSVRCIKD